MNRLVVPFGDSAWLVEVETVAAAQELARSVEGALRRGLAPGGIGNVVIGFRSVVVQVDPLAIHSELAREWLAELDPRAGAAREEFPPPDRLIDIPVTFDGADLEAVAATTGMSASGVVDKLTGIELRVAFLGFSPGFPYLVGLPPELAAIRRRDGPRPSVPRGSVAIAGGFAALYPQPTPGGWMLLGRTSLSLFDPDASPYALLRPGDRVRFRKADGSRADEAGGSSGHGTPSLRSPLRSESSRFIEVLEPGFLSLVEDGGRTSVASIGVPPAGPADPDAMKLANRLVSNADDAAVVEVTAVGPTLRFAGDAHAAVVGMTSSAFDLAVDGHNAGPGAVVPIRNGQTLQVGRVRRGLRAYIGIGGGIETPRVMGSRSSDVLSGIGPGPLMAGDQLGLGRPNLPRGFLTHALSDVTSPEVTTIRVVAGPHHYSPEELHRFQSTLWRVEAASNRVGLRLSVDGPLPQIEVRRIDSAGMVAGAVQLPPDGRPIVLMPDHATVGGYPVIACVITADRGKLGQLRGGDQVRFEGMSHFGARIALVENERRLAGRVAGWFPSKPGT